MTVIRCLAPSRMVTKGTQPNQARYPRQKVMIVAIENYAHLVPYVDEDDYYFLKTVLPSRKATRDLVHKGEPDVET